MLECWNNGKEENKLRQDISLFLKSIIPLFQYSNPEEFDFVLVPLLAKRNPYFKGSSFIDFAFYRDFSMMV